jgi:hypothetical protein
MTKLDVSGSSTRTLGDMDVDNYHGYFAYYFGDPDAKVKPVLHGRLRRHALQRRAVHARWAG